MAGFLTLTPSSFLPTRNFGLLAALAMGVALWANLILLPGLLGLRSTAVPLPQVDAEPCAATIPVGSFRNRAL